MGFRQPFTLHTDSKNPGLIGVGEYCHDGSTDRAQRSPAGTCEWNLVNKAANMGWPFCVGDQSAANTMWRWNYANQTHDRASSTTARSTRSRRTSTTRRRARRPTRRRSRAST